VTTTIPHASPGVYADWPAESRGSPRNSQKTAKQAENRFRFSSVRGFDGSTEGKSSLFPVLRILARKVILAADGTRMRIAASHGPFKHDCPRIYVGFSHNAILHLALGLKDGRRVVESVIEINMQEGAEPESQYFREQTEISNRCDTLTRIAATRRSLVALCLSNINFYCNQREWHRMC
jgi:hypothetical protein